MILLTIIWVLFILNIYLFIRNNNVFIFRTYITNLIYINDDWKSLVEEFETVSYSKMVLSFKRLRPENWYSAEFCEKISSKL